MDDDLAEVLAEMHATEAEAMAPYWSALQAADDAMWAEFPAD